MRLYVEAEGRPGVWFLSLDAANPLAVWAARRYFHLPYYHADMHVTSRDGWIHFASQRRGGGPRFQARYRPTAPACEAAAGTLEHWLTERYCLYARRPEGTLVRNEVHHVPWPLQPAEAHVDANTMLHPYGLVATGDPVCHFASWLDVVVWTATPVSVTDPPASP